MVRQELEFIQSGLSASTTSFSRHAPGSRRSKMNRTTTFVLALALVLAAASPTLAQQGPPPYTTDNSQQACVQYGSCSTDGGASVITATQNAPVTPPAGTPAIATLTTFDSSFLSSLAAAGASSAYNQQGGAGANPASPLTITSTVSRGRATNSAGSGGGSTMSLGGLGSGNAGTVVEVKGAVVQLLIVCSAAVVGAALLL